MMIIVELLTQKFDSPAGEIGNVFRLNGRKQLINESLSDYLEALMMLARKTNINEDEQHNKIIDTVLEHAKEPKIRKKVLKWVSKAHELHYDDEERWRHFNELIKGINKLAALEAYTSHIAVNSRN